MFQSSANLSGGIAFLASILHRQRNYCALCLGLNEDNDSFSPSEGSVVDLVCPSVAALLCALVYALGLNSAIRYVVRCGYSFGLWTSEQIPALDELPSTSTVPIKSALSQIPATAYESGQNLTVTDCSICLGEFAEGEKVRLVPKCSHVFHAMCIDTWLLSNPSCPLCRQALIYIVQDAGIS